MPSPIALSTRPWTGWLTLAARLTLGITVFLAGALKLPYLESSVQAVRAYQILPFEITRPFGYALPVVEVAIGLLLITGTFTRIAAIAGGLLMLVFIAGIASVWVRGISIDCGCFGGGGEVDSGATQYPQEIARDIGLFLCGAWAVWRPRSPFAVDGWLFPTDPIPSENEPHLEESTR